MRCSTFPKRFRITYWPFVSLFFSACATAQQPKTLWRNTSSTQRYYARDSQECEIIANALVPAAGNPFLKLAFYKSEWSRCMNGRGWEEVSAASVAQQPKPASISVAVVAARWLQLSRTPELTSYLDTTRIERTPTHIVSVWVRADYSSLQSVEGIHFTRMVTRREYDCAARLTRFTAVAVYDDAGTVLRAEQYDSARWTSPVPESSDEAMLQALCRSSGSRP